MEKQEALATPVDEVDRTLTSTPAFADALSEKKHEQGIFVEPGSIPLPDAGYHHLGVVYEGLTVHGAGATHRTVESFEMAALNMWNLPRFLKTIFNWKTGPTRELIQDFYGVVPAGESMLVLGRPGSGCSTLLRAIANERAPFVKVTGDVSYSTINAKDAAKYYQGEIVFNNEEDNHEPLLTVAQTLDKALLLKQPNHLPHPQKRSVYVKDMTNRLLKTFGMPHTAGTKVGDDRVRGVSGGERKRVSLSEMLTTNAAVVCWDNSIRGLDSAVALHYLKVIKELARSTGMTNIVSIYQASDEMYATCFDRVTVIYEGQMVFSGRTTDAVAYFTEQGWQRKARQTVPDFLTACTSPTERIKRADHQGFIPQTPVEMAEYFKASPAFKKLQDDIVAYKIEHAASSHAEYLADAVAKGKHFGAGKTTPYKVNFAQQTWVLIKRQVELVNADRKSFAVKIGSNILQALVVGAIFYKPSRTASGSFATAGAIFFTILYFVVFALGEVAPTVLGRPLLVKHRKLGFYHPAAKVLAEMLIDIPLYAIQTLVFASIFYFLLGLNPSAQYFFTFWFVIFTTYLALSVMYRMIATWSPNLSVAIRYASAALSIVLTVAGYTSPPPQQHKWASWMRRISPVSYAFEALLANEFRTRTLQCSSAELVPSGPGYGTIDYQGCGINGGTPGSATVDGLDYIASKYGYSASNIWRNVGILWAMYVVYSFMVVLGASILIKDTGASSSKLFIRGAKEAKPKGQTASQSESDISSDAGSVAEDMAEDVVAKSSKVSSFTFKDVCYTVQVNGEDRRLLDNISGVFRSGRLTALMGASGAGKTTLLNTVSMRQTTGKVEGTMCLQGQPLGPTFSRRTGFAQQGDVHEPFSTVRECLQFSALLRQTGSETREERLAYAEKVIELLELGPIADAIIGNMDIGGLGVEERKRVTIGVELAAKPDSLIFLDEPTSGLDSQAAYDICRLLRRISSTGLMVICVVHQPSGDLFDMFDDLILLAPGGKTVYAGPTGKNATAVSSYFAKHGAVMAADANPAEHLIATVAPVGGTDTDWPRRWRESEEAAAILREIDEATGGTYDAGDEDDSAFATSYFTQCKELIKRNFRAQYREGSYYTTKLFVAIYFGLFTGFYQYMLPHTVSGMQTLSIGLLVVCQMAASISFDIALNYQAKMGIYVARERNGIYGWPALLTSLAITETPILVIAYTLSFFCCFWTFGINSAPWVGALVWLDFVIFAMWTVTFGMLLGAVSPSPFASMFILSFAWNVFNSLSWALQPWPVMPQPFHSFFSWLSPLRYLFGSIMEGTLSQLAVTCSVDEVVYFNIPDGATCASYAADFLASAPGYLTGGNGIAACGYCSMSSGADYTNMLGYLPVDRWRGFGILIVHTIANLGFAFLATWLLRIRPLYKS